MIAQPIVFEIADGVCAINEYGLDTVYLVLGEERAALIDTGMGCFDLRAVVEHLTPLPLMVLLTHGHLDHAGGIDQFDEVCVHPADMDAARKISREARMNSCRRMRGLEGDADVWDYADEAPRAWERLPRMLPLEDGLRFPLGGRELLCVHTPGHSPGSCCFIDSKSRILFSGDACNVNLMVTDCAVSEALEGLEKLKSMEGEFDRNFNGHLGYSSGMTHTAMPRSVLDDCLIACRRVLTGTAEPCSVSQSRWAGEVKTFLHGAVSLTWRPENEKGGE